VVRRKRRDPGDYLPERLQRFEPSEWPNGSFILWRTAVRKHVEEADWLSTNQPFWLKAIQGIYSENNRRILGR
jgi:hypothetical protein